jgi:hypothetical protein
MSERIHKQLKASYISSLRADSSVRGSCQGDAIEPLRPQRVSGCKPRVFSVHPPLPRGMEVMPEQSSTHTRLASAPPYTRTHHTHTHLLILVQMCAGDGREWDDMRHASRGLPPYLVHYTSRMCVWKSERRRRGAGDSGAAPTLLLPNAPSLLPL